MKNWNKILRWVHFLAGLSISYYFFFMPAFFNDTATTEIYTFGIVSFVFWTGIIRWNLPRIRRWSKNRSAA
jgi:hypothetical protein